MKKLNKKGFTLAELLIVIAIIAILIAIAIPAFGTALDNARLQTDHANMRSCYAMMQVGSLQGYIETSAAATPTVKLEATNKGKYYFNADGSLSGKDDSSKAYKTAAKGDAEKCKSSAFCQKVTVANHQKAKGFGVQITDTGDIQLFIDT